MSRDTAPTTAPTTAVGLIAALATGATTRGESGR